MLEMKLESYPLAVFLVNFNPLNFVFSATLRTPLKFYENVKQNESQQLI